MKINEISPLEHNFTEVLKKLVLIPEILYYYGKLPENRSKNEVSAGPGKRPKCVAIVGSRRNTKYGEEVAYRAAYEAARRGAIVISGLAYGIDSIAHRGALDAGGITIAILGTPITEIYPRSHTKLATEIIESGGAIISEYGPEDAPESGKEMKARFLARNRLIASLSDAVLIAEAAEKSGSLNTASHAAEMGIELLAAPGDITRATSRGTNRLIAQGVTPYTAPEDLLAILFPEPKKRKRITDAEKLRRLAQFAETETETKILGCLALGIQDGDAMIRELNLSQADFLQAMTMLEIRGAVKSLGSNEWIVRL